MSGSKVLTIFYNQVSHRNIGTCICLDGVLQCKDRLLDLSSHGGSLCLAYGMCSVYIMVGAKGQNRGSEVDLPKVIWLVRGGGTSELLLFQMVKTETFPHPFSLHLPLSVFLCLCLEPVIALFKKEKTTTVPGLYNLVQFLNKLTQSLFKNKNNYLLLRT